MAYRSKPNSHGEARRGNLTPEFKVWVDMRRRCTDSNHQSWDRYGGRGIKVCDRWQDYKNFLVDMGRRPSPEHSIDRIDSNGHYEPSNCRWVTVDIQAKNKRNTVWITALGRTMTMTDWAKHTGIRKETLHYRLKLGWSHEKTVTTPPVKGRNQHTITVT